MQRVVRSGEPLARMVRRHGWRARAHRIQCPPRMEAAVSTLAMFEAPGMTVEQYDRVMEALQMRSDDDLPGGAVSHVAGSTGDGILAVDIWEDEEALGRFVETRL